MDADLQEVQLANSKRCKGGCVNKETYTRFQAGLTWMVMESSAARRPEEDLEIVLAEFGVFQVSSFGKEEFQVELPLPKVFLDAP